MSLKRRLRRLKEEALEGGVLIHQRDGSVRAFEEMEVHKQLFLVRMAVFKGEVPASAVFDAVRNATPDSRGAFEERYGKICPTQYVIGSPSDGGWVDSYTLTEEGRVEVVRYEGDSEEARRVREGVRAGTSTELPSELPRPPVAGRWVEPGLEDLSEP